MFVIAWPRLGVGWRRILTAGIPIPLKVVACASFTLAASQLMFLGFMGVGLAAGMFANMVSGWRLLSAEFLAIALGTIMLTATSFALHYAVARALLEPGKHPWAGRGALGAHAGTLVLAILPPLLQSTFPPLLELVWPFAYMFVSLGLLGAAASIAALVSLSTPSARAALMPR